jgi:hypothetical protein
LRKTMRSAKKVWVNDLVAHTVSEGNRLYKGTKWENSWVIYHDALSAWWDPAAQGLLKKLGMQERQIRAWGPTSAAELTREERDAGGKLIKLHVYINKYRFKLMGDSPEFMPLDRHLFNDVKLACKRNCSLTRVLPDRGKRKFWFNTPKEAFRSLARSWQYSPAPDRIVEDILEFFESIDLVVESLGVYVDLNVRNGRRLLNFGDGAVQHKRVRPTRTKEASMSNIDDLHPDSRFCGNQVVAVMLKSGLKCEARGADLKSMLPVEYDPEELVLEEAVWNVPLDPPAQHTMAMWNYVGPEVIARKQKEKQEKQAVKDAKKAKTKSDKEAATALKRAAKVALKGQKPTKKQKTKPKKKKKERTPPHFEGFPDYYPPAGHILEFDFGGWYEGEFIKMIIDEDGDELCHLKDTTTGDIHKVQLRTEEDGQWIECSDWYPLFDCFECEVGTRGNIVCEVCGVCKDGADDFSSDGDSE